VLTTNIVGNFLCS